MNKIEIIHELMGDLQKRFGASTVRLANEVRTLRGRWSTGSFVIDYILGGGLPPGKAIQFKGFDASGKTSTAIICAASFIAQGGTVCWIKGEDFDRDWARKLGLGIPAGPDEDEEEVAKLIEEPLEPESLLFVEGTRGEELLQASLEVMKSGAFDLIIVDSISSLSPGNLLDKGLEEGEHRIQKAGLYTRWVERVYSAMGMHFDPETGNVSKQENATRNPTSIIFINQLRDIFTRRGPLAPDARGGWALKYLKRADLFFKGSAISKGEKGSARIVEREIEVRSTTSQISPEGRQGKFTLFTESVDGKQSGQIDIVGEVVDLGVQLGLIEIGGSWYTYGDKKFHGRNKLKAYLQNAEAIFDLQQNLRKEF